MTSIAPIPVQVKPFALICSFQVPTTEVNPDLHPVLAWLLANTKHKNRQSKRVT